MQNQSLLPSPSTPDQPQSIAALIPEEIVDSVIQHLSFDYSMDVDWQEYMERVECLSSVSRVVSGWKEPARRMLMRSIKLSTLEGLQTMPEWASDLVGTLELDLLRRVGDVKPVVLAHAVSQFLQRLPFLTTLSLCHLPFPIFPAADSLILRSNVFLPHLRDLRLYTRHSFDLILDILTTTNHSISRLDISEGAELFSGEGMFDFKGNLRYLKLRGHFSATVLGHRPSASVVIIGLAGVSLDLAGLAGLAELNLMGIRYVQGDTARLLEVFKVIGPTLKRLSLPRNHEITLDQALLALVPHLSYLCLSSLGPNACALHHLPPSLSVLSLEDDHLLELFLAAWARTPSMVPRGLQNIHIDFIHHASTLERLPPIDKITTSYYDGLVPALRPIASRPLPVKTLDLKFMKSDPAAGIRAVELRCLALGLEFRAVPWE